MHRVLGLMSNSRKSNGVGVAAAHKFFKVFLSTFLSNVSRIYSSQFRYAIRIYWIVRIVYPDFPMQSSAKIGINSRQESSSKFQSFNTIFHKMSISYM